MHTNRSSPFLRAFVGSMMVTGVLALIPCRGNAQGRNPDTGMAPNAASDSMPVALVIAVFPGPEGAQQAMSDQNTAQQLGNAKSYAVVSKDKSGKMKVQRKHGGGKGGQRNARADNAIDGAIALLGQPPQGGGGGGYKNDQAAGGATGNAGLSQADADKMSAALTPGNSAIILVVDDPSLAAADSTMQGANASQVMSAPLAPSAPKQ